MKISVIIPTYNRWEKLENLLKSLEKQTNTDFETIVIDDGSTDKTLRNLKEYEKNTTLKLIVVSQTKKGPAIARNKGIEKANSEKILFLNDDVIADTKLIEEHLKFEGKGKTVLGWIKPTKTTMQGWKYYYGPHFHYKQILFDLENLPFLYFITANLLVEKGKIIDVGLFNTDFKLAFCEDIELGYKMEKKGIKIIFNRKAIVYHDHPLSIEEFAQQQYMRGTGYATLISKHPELLDDERMDIEKAAERITNELHKKLISKNIPIPEGFIFKKPMIYAAKKIWKTKKNMQITPLLEKLIWIYYFKKGSEDQRRHFINKKK